MFGVSVLFIYGSHTTFQCVQRKWALLTRTYAKLSRRESGGVRGGVGIGLTPPAILRSRISASDRGERESSR